MLCSVRKVGRSVQQVQLNMILEFDCDVSVWYQILSVIAHTNWWPDFAKSLDLLFLIRYQIQQ